MTTLQRITQSHQLALRAGGRSVRTRDAYLDSLGQFERWLSNLGESTELGDIDRHDVRAWLGHVSISTTNIYAEIDLTLKARAVALCEVGHPQPGRSWKEDKDLMAFLKSL